MDRTKLKCDICKRELIDAYTWVIPNYNKIIVCKECDMSLHAQIWYIIGEE